MQLKSLRESVSVDSQKAELLLTSLEFHLQNCVNERTQIAINKMLKNYESKLQAYSET